MLLSSAFLKTAWNVLRLHYNRLDMCAFELCPIRPHTLNLLPVWYNLLGCHKPYHLPIAHLLILSSPYSCSTTLEPCFTFPFRNGCPLAHLFCHSVKEWWLVSPLGEVFLVLVVEAADPAFLLQRYIKYEYVPTKSIII